MKILVACEESQVVTKEFRKLGHAAYSCDIEPSSGGHPEWHLQEDVIPLLNKNWDMIIAFPPCTYLSVASAVRLYPQKGNIDPARYEKGLEARSFFMRLHDSKCPKIVIENPVSLKVFDIPKHTQQIEPYEFGHPYYKKTRLWIKGLPLLKPTNIITENIVSWVNAGTKDVNGRPRKQLGVKCGARNRSKTFPGIAKAMAEQWGVINLTLSWSRTLKLCSCGVLYSPTQYPLGCPLYHVGILDKALMKTELIMKKLGMI